VVVAFDTTVVTGAFLRPAGINYRLLELAAHGTPVLQGFATDAVGAEFWWKTTQQGLRLRGTLRTWPEEDVAEFLEVFDPLFRPENMRQAPLGRELGSRFAGLVGLTLGEVLHAITGKDRDALLSSVSAQQRVLFEPFDINDLHVLAGAIANGADILCSSDSRNLALSPLGSLKIDTPSALAVELGLTSGPGSSLVAPSPSP
jgi:hypothetical protein